MHVFIFSSLIFLLSQCDVHNEEQGYGLRVWKISIESENLADLQSTTMERTFHPAKLELGPKTYQIRLRYSGQSTLDDIKKNYHIVAKEEIDGLHQQEYRLSSQWIDPTAIRALTAHHVYSKAGLLTSQIEPVALYMNGLYHGLYFAIEPINERFFQRRQRHVSMVFKSRYAGADFREQSFKRAYDFYKPVVGRKSQRPIGMIIQALKIKDMERRMQRLGALIDLKQYVRYAAVTLFLNNKDGYTNNVHFASEDGIKYFSLPWDFDTVIPVDRDSLLIHIPETLCGKGKLLAGILEDPEYQSLYFDELESLMRMFPISEMNHMFESFSSKINRAYDHDRHRIRKYLSQMDQVKVLKQSFSLWYERLQDVVHQRQLFSCR